MRRLIVRALIQCVLFQAGYLLFLRLANPPITLTQLGAAIDTHTLKRDYVSQDSISDHARLAVLASEDQRFPTHGGFDWHSVHAVLLDREAGGKRLRGASIISQQTAKNIFLWQKAVGFGREWRSILPRCWSSR